LVVHCRGGIHGDTRPASRCWTITAADVLVRAQEDATRRVQSAGLPVGTSSPQSCDQVAPPRKTASSTPSPVGSGTADCGWGAQSERSVFSTEHRARMTVRRSVVMVQNENLLVVKWLFRWCLNRPGSRDCSGYWVMASTAVVV
jgi:hypothetical protein